ncbi:hypothetical protein ACIG0D_31360 [Streptomyces sp. NPDC052773]|uniref:hypothetical protein n=1 Tax=Streptomyces sp. NPDC052773 TaxID=3365693 RepID=UPI0037CE0894
MANRMNRSTRTLSARRVLVLSVALTSLATPLAFAGSEGTNSGVTVANVGANANANAATAANQATITSLADFEREVREDRTVTRKEVTFKNGELDMAGVRFAPPR